MRKFSVFLVLFLNDRPQEKIRSQSQSPFKESCSSQIVSTQESCLTQVIEKIANPKMRSSIPRKIYRPTKPSISCKRMQWNEDDGQ
jgi:hypothetical protein